MSTQRKVKQTNYTWQKCKTKQTNEPNESENNEHANNRERNRCK